MITLDPLSILVTIVYVGALYFFLARFFFGPITRILTDRRQAIEGRLEEAARRIEEVEKKAAEYEAALREARSEAYQMQETLRDRATEERARLLLEARREAEAIIAEAQARLAGETAETRRRLEVEVEALAARLTDVLLQDSATK